MDFRRLAARQKRVDEWWKAIESNAPGEEIRLRFVDTLKRYRNLLARCWEIETVSEDDEQQIEDLERQLEQLHEDSRL